METIEKLNKIIDSYICLTAEIELINDELREAINKLKDEENARTQKQEYYKKYYEEVKKPKLGEYAKKRRLRYREDPEYRAKVCEAARLRHVKKVGVQRPRGRQIKHI